MFAAEHQDVRRTRDGNQTAATVSVPRMAYQRRRSRAFAVVPILVLVAEDAHAAIRNCVDDPACRQLPSGSSLLTGASAASPMLRAANVLLAANAHELATWSKDSVLVASGLPVRLPRKHRQVGTTDEGRRALTTCSAERLLLVVTPKEIHRSPNGTIFVDLAVEEFGADCDRPDRHVFRHGENYYRVVLRRRQVDIRWTLKISD
jgi:hypothetical protein